MFSLRYAFPFLCLLSFSCACLADESELTDEDLYGDELEYRANDTPMFGEYKIRINATNAEMWKAKWHCEHEDGSLSLIDADTFPASTRTTRSTNITPEKCPTGIWKVSFELKKNSNWRDVKPAAAICGNKEWCGFYPDHRITLGELLEGVDFDRYARPDQDWTNSADKLCVVGINTAWDKVYLYKEACAE